MTPSILETMHRALDELHDRLEEKRTRLCRHIAAIEQLRQIGTKNGLLDLFSGISLEDLGRNGLAVSESALKDCWTDSLDENSFDAFNAATEVLLQELVLNNDNADAQKQVVKRLFSEAIDNLGFPGYIFIAALFLAATGEGAMAAELATDLPITLTPAHGKVALEFMKEDLEILLDEIAYIIAQYHECISGTSVLRREQFLAMIEKCKAGEIDLIITKQVSRFARNVLDSLNYIFMLRKLDPPVGVYFETEKLNTLDKSSDMVITVLSLVAQSESEQKSNSLKWSFKRRRAQGLGVYPNWALLGYALDEEKTG